MDTISIVVLLAAIGSLGWTIYTDLLATRRGPSPDTIARQVRITLREAGVEKDGEVVVNAREVVTTPIVAEETLEQRIDRLSKTFQESGRLIEQVSAELEARSLTARRLKEEASNAEALARLHKDQAEAVKRMMRAEVHEEMLVELSKGLERANRQNFRDSVKIAVVSFFGGGALSIAITIFVH